MSEPLFAVMVVLKFSDQTFSGNSPDMADGEPTHFMPLFESEKAAQDWAPDGAQIQRFDRGKKP
jgi:hypothetical protein